MRNSRQRPLRVGVLVDLERRPTAGGHVKVWERLAAAAVGRGEALDLTVHFSSSASARSAADWSAAAAASAATPHSFWRESGAVEVLADNVRLRSHRPIFSSARLSFLSHVPDHSDLAPYHRPLARHLGRADVLHTTDAYFAFARTAEWIARHHGVPMVSSVHTNTPSYTRLYTADTVQRLWGVRWLAPLLIDRLRLADRAEQHMLRRLRAHQDLCAFALVSRPAELEALAGKLPRARLGLIRRGVDHALFSPAARDRPWLESTFGLPPDRQLVLYVGRIDRTKNVDTVVEAVAALAGQGNPIHLLAIGHGDLREKILHRLPGVATCPGPLPPETLARVYASSDLFVQPSELEECSNVVLEALSSGLPVLVPEQGGSGRLLIDRETGLVVRGAGVPPWVVALRALLGDPERRRAIGVQARQWAEREIPSWGDVLAQDLLPRWRAAAATAPRRPGELPLAFHP
jgi:glycosyltransferase involved in cell wall biosynthesis